MVGLLRNQTKWTLWWNAVEVRWMSRGAQKKCWDNYPYQLRFDVVDRILNHKILGLECVYEDVVCIWEYCWQVVRIWGDWEGYFSDDIILDQKKQKCNDCQVIFLMKVASLMKRIPLERSGAVLKVQHILNVIIYNILS